MALALVFNRVDSQEQLTIFKVAAVNQEHRLVI